MTLVKAIHTYGDALHSAPLMQLASSAAIVHAGRHGKALSIFESVITSAAIGHSAPVWFIKDLALSIIAGKTVCGKQSEEKHEQKVKTARPFMIQGLINMGIDAAVPLAALAGMGYACTTYPEKHKDQIHSSLNSTETMFAEFNKHFNALAAVAGSPETVVKLLQWVQDNGKLAVEFAEQIPDFKPFAKMIPSIAAALHGVIGEARDKEKLGHLIKRVERANTAPLIGMALASGTFSLALHGRTYSKIDSALIFAATALTAKIHIIANIFLIVIGVFAAIFTMHGKAFLITQICKLKLNLQCFGVAFAGAISPAYGAKWTKEKMDEVFPKGMMGFVQELSTYAKGNIEETIKNIHAAIGYVTKTVQDKKFPQSKQIMAFAILKMKESPDNVQKIMELLELFPALAKMLPTPLSGFFPKILNFLDKHSHAVQKIVQYTGAGLSLEDAVAKTHAEHIELEKDLNSNFTNMIKDSNHAVVAALQAASSTSIFHALLPKHVKEDVIPVLPELVQIHATHPEAVQEALTVAVEKKVHPKKTLKELALSNPALEGVLKNLGFA